MSTQIPQPLPAETRGVGMSGHLMTMLEYRVVLGALVTTLDGLVVAHAGLSPEDAELLAAASSAQPDDQPYASDVTPGGTLHVLRGDDMRLVALTDIAAPRDLSPRSCTSISFSSKRPWPCEGRGPRDEEANREALLGTGNWELISSLARVLRLPAGHHDRLFHALRMVGMRERVEPVRTSVV